jgi:hypothetical protein
MPDTIPLNVDSEGEEGYFGPPYQNNVGDDKGDFCSAAGPSGTRPTNSLDTFMQEFEDLFFMDGPDM